MYPEALNLGSYKIGKNHPTLFLPDIGTFFNQDIEKAKDLVNQVAESGVHTIKGEILHSAEICLKNGSIEAYWSHKQGKKLVENYRTLIERKTVALSEYDKLFSYGKSLGLEIVLSVYDFEGADFAKGIGAVALKIASSNITHRPLIEYLARLDIPMIIDTGHSTMEEIGRAVNWAQDAGVNGLIVEHSPPGPPNGLEVHNLQFMNTLKESFGVLSGLSDHHAGEEMLYAATALGAALVEKGLCPDDMGDDQDVSHALPVGKLKEVHSKIINISNALGNGIRYLPRDRAKYKSRMGLVAKKSLLQGSRINLENVTFAFPATGIKTEFWGEVNGWKLKEAKAAGEPINWTDVSSISS